MQTAITRHRQAGHFPQIARDGFGLAALFGVDSGVGAGGIEEGDDRPAELGRQLHGAQGLAVALRLRHAEIAVELLFGVAAFLLADQHDGLAVEPAHAADDGRIVAEKAVAVDLLKVGQDALNVVERVRPLGMARVLDSLPGGLSRRQAGSYGALHRCGIFFRILHADQRYSRLDD